jgi:hypothetical protein
MKIRTILDQIDLGSMALPEFQRGYVWNREQVRGLMDSLYRKHPVGSLLVWVTKTETAEARGNADLPPGTVKLLLDGQQRITSLYGIIRGRPPAFFEGNAQAFTGLHFNLRDHSFEFFAPLKMKDNPMWVDVTELMQIGAGEAIKKLVQVPELQDDITAHINALNAIDAIKEIDLHIEDVAGEDKTVDVVVDIFNRVNSGGTKLSKGDLALAKICAEWPDARAEMNRRLDKWRRAGFYFRLEWLLRNINAVLTGEALFAALKDVDAPTFECGLVESEKAIDLLLNLIAARLGLDHDRVLGSRYSFPLMARYVVTRGGHLQDHVERDKLLFWYIHTILWGRYAGSTETVLNQDLRLIEGDTGSLHRLIEQLRQIRPDLRVHPNDFMGWSKGARFYPLLYMLTRVWHAQDWATGIELKQHLLGKFTNLEVHHVFPKALLYRHDYSRPDANAIANFTFLTHDTNMLVLDRDPAEYLEEFAAKNPGALESHWIPMDRELWRVERYHDFLAARRDVLADAANQFLDSLRHGAVPETPEVPSVLDRDVVVLPGAIASADEEQTITDLNEWVLARGLPQGEVSYELVDASTGEPVAVLDLAWPEGLQEGLSQPVALLLDESEEIEAAANTCGYRYFTAVEQFREYVRRDVLAETEEPAFAAPV